MYVSVYVNNSIYISHVVIYVKYMFFKFVHLGSGFPLFQTWTNKASKLVFIFD